MLFSATILWQIKTLVMIVVRVVLFGTVESLQQNEHLAGSFCGRPPGGVALPYASTTIVGGAGGGGLATISSTAGAGGGCIPNPQAYMIQPQPPSSSSDNFVPRSDVKSDRGNDYPGTCPGTS